MTLGIGDFIRQTYRGRTIYRLLFNRLLGIYSADLMGVGLDLASGPHPSYHAYLPSKLQLTTSDYHSGPGINLVLDLNRPFALEADSYDVVLFCNALYVVKDPVALMREINRILKPGGRLFLVSPFLANEMPEPDDFCRFTAQGLESLLQQTDFYKIQVFRFGERFTAAAYLLNPIWFFRTLRLLVYGLCLMLDQLIPKRVRSNHPTPLGYLVMATKK